MSRPRRVARLLMILTTWLLGLVAAVLAATTALFYTLNDIRQPAEVPLQVGTIQYSDGSTLARIGSVDRTIVSLDKVPHPVRWAVLAAEDRGFYGEPGVSLKGTARAAWADLTGGDTQGGSGITQQYVKNAYLNNSQTLSRKLRELAIAVKLTREHSKDEILSDYLNTVYFGRGAYGIQAAAQAYFGENVEQLTTAQGALLAGLLRAPSYYDPANDRNAAQLRWRYVLDGMVATKHLSAAAEATLVFPATKAPHGTGLGTSGWQSLLTNRVLAELAAHHITADDINRKGMIIRTTIDRKAQAAALHAIRTEFAHLTPRQRNLKNALVAVDPKTGGVLAYYGGSGPGVKGYDGTVNYNDWAAQRANPAGSTFKPYTLATVLGQTIKQTPGVEHVAINSRVDGSQCSTIDGTKICNDPSDKAHSSPDIKVSLAMKYSLNTTFDLLALQAGPANVAATAHAMGVAKTDSDGRATLVGADGQTSFGIGIGDYAVTPLDQASGYATLANNGVRNDAYLVQRVTASNGAAVYQHQSAPEQAIDSRVANDVTMTLKPIAKYSGDALTDGRPSAAKTGTEGIDSKSRSDVNNSDAWMVGFTPKVSAAVWVGTGARAPIYNSAGKPLYGSNLPGRTWKLFLDTYLHGTPQQKLPNKQLIGADGKIPASAPDSATEPAGSTPTQQPTQSSTGPASPTDSPSTPTDTPGSTTSTPSTTPAPTTSEPSTSSSSSSSSAPPSTAGSSGSADSHASSAPAQSSAAANNASHSAGPAQDDGLGATSRATRQNASTASAH